MTLKKKDLAIHLSRLQTFVQPSAALEQYATPSELAAQVLWDAALQGDIDDKVIADFGCGTGILGLGALLLGAKQVFFIDLDVDALAFAKKNLQSLEATTGKTFSASFLHTSVETFHHTVDVVLQNPPFGVQKEHADKVFLEKAMQLANVIYTIHKVESQRFLTSLSTDHNFTITHFWKANFVLKKTQTFHHKEHYTVPVGIWRLERDRKL
ncbi:MAG: METTL5 family protein [Candidatus Woesearchaeota archaeon]|nr:METTL5 family protein [Candidatus Woesearchaeota archaeon]